MANTNMNESMRSRLEAALNDVGDVRVKMSRGARPGLWTGAAYDSRLALIVDLDPYRGIDLLVGSVGDDGVPHTGRARSDSGGSRRYATDFIDQMPESLVGQLRSLAGTWDPDRSDTWDQLRSALQAAWGFFSTEGYDGWSRRYRG